MVSVCTVPARGGRSCEHFGGYKTINRIPLSYAWFPGGCQSGQLIARELIVRLGLLIFLVGAKILLC